MTHLSLSSEITYIETPRRATSPVKIDAILAERLKAFQRIRRIRRFTFGR
jgi:hypothetical protein